MQDILGRVMLVVAGCYCLFILPVMIIASKQDNLKQSYIDSAVTEFVDNARASGKITPEAYERLCNRVDAAHLVCSIQMIHSSKYVSPNAELDASGHNTYETYRTDYNKEEILSYMYPSSPYEENRSWKMKNGDFLKVIVQNETPTLGSRLSLFFTTRGDTKTLYTSYGGYVGNTQQDYRPWQNH